MGKIVLLDDLTINKIAAGEVIERPASAVKEMVENSIDAGAKNITVEIKNGGISLIRITDDGCGISEDDMEIAFEKHATSKIRKAEDLETILSMGFRGEALATIAAIAKVEMISRTADSETGHKIVVEGGVVLETSEVGCPVGTTITVQNLFYNQSARFKFMRKDYTEAGYIEDVITRIALINKDVAIKFINTDKTVIQTNGNGDLKTSIYNIYGNDIANEIIEVEYEYEDMKVTGVIGKPEIVRANRSNQVFFVNGRYVKDKNLTAAAEQAYKGMIPIGKYGFLVLNLEIDPRKVDVNVHPAKLEVRFEEEGQVFKAIYHSIKSGFEKMELFKSARTETPFKSEIKSEEKIEKKAINIAENNIIVENIINNKFSPKSNETKEIDTALVNETLKEKTQELLSTKLDNSQLTQVIDIKKTLEESKSNEVEDASSFGDVVKEVSQDTIETNLNKELKEEPTGEFSKVAEKLLKAKLDFDNTQIIDTVKIREALQETTEESADFKEMYKKTFGVEPLSVRKEKEIETQENEKINISSEFMNANLSVFDNKEEGKSINYKFVGIAFSTYIIIEIKNEMYIIDQHAAHERIMYEKVKANYYSEELKEGQLLLLPDVITLKHKEMSLARENITMFSRAGFEFEEFGENTIKLTTVPSMCEDMNTKQLFLDILDEIDEIAVNAIQEKEEKFIATVACKSAIKANMRLDEQEVDNLMKELLELESPFTCPHGRPTAIKMTKYDMERKFNRK